MSIDKDNLPDVIIKAIKDYYGIEFDYIEIHEVETWAYLKKPKSNNTNANSQ